MARADYIYLVRTGSMLSATAVPVAAFTVKHELARYLRSKSPEMRGTMEVYRLHDGGREGAVQMDIDEIIGGTE